MKINLAKLTLFAAIMPITILAQDKFYSGDKNNPFTQEDKKFNDWAISAGVGVPLVQSADLTSIKNGNGKKVETEVVENNERDNIINAKNTYVSEINGTRNSNQQNKDNEG